MLPCSCFHVITAPEKLLVFALHFNGSSSDQYYVSNILAIMSKAKGITVQVKGSFDGSMLYFQFPQRLCVAFGKSIYFLIYKVR